MKIKGSCFDLRGASSGSCERGQVAFVTGPYQRVSGCSRWRAGSILDPPSPSSTPSLKRDKWERRGKVGWNSRGEPGPPGGRNPNLVLLLYFLFFFNGWGSKGQRASSSPPKGEIEVTVPTFFLFPPGVSLPPSLPETHSQQSMSGR